MYNEIIWLTVNSLVTFYKRNAIDLRRILGYTWILPQSGIHAEENEGGREMAEVEIGKVSDFFARPVVAGVDLVAPLKAGDMVHITGHTTDLVMTVGSMQIDNADVDEASAGVSVGIKVPDRVRKGDTVYKVTD